MLSKLTNKYAEQFPELISLSALNNFGRFVWLLESMFCIAPESFLDSFAWFKNLAQNTEDRGHEHYFQAYGKFNMHKEADFNSANTFLYSLPLFFFY